MEEVFGEGTSLGSASHHASDALISSKNAIVFHRVTALKGGEAVLTNVTVSFQFGVVTFMLAPAESSLAVADVIRGNAIPMRTLGFETTGAVYQITNQAVKAPCSNKIAYWNVEDDILPDGLTPRTFLELVASGRGESCSVEDLLGIAGLGDARDKDIRLLSPGKQRSLSIVRSMVGLPTQSVCVIVEPARALSMQDSNDVFTSIQAIADMGWCVVVSSCQPGSIPFKAKHEIVCVGSTGQLLFAGPASAAPLQLTLQGHECPQGMSYGDFLAGVLPHCPSGMQQSLADTYINSAPALETRKLAEACASYLPSSARSNIGRGYIEEQAKQGFLKQTWRLVAADVTAIVRDRRWIVKNLVGPLLLSCIFGSIFFSLPFDMLGLQARCGAVAMLLAVLAVDAAAGVPRLQGRATVLAYEDSDGHVSRAAALTALCFSEIVVRRMSKGLCVAVGCAAAGRLAPGMMRISGWLILVSLASGLAATGPLVVAILRRPTFPRLASARDGSESSKAQMGYVRRVTTSSATAFTALGQLLAVGLCGYPLPAHMQPIWLSALKPVNLYAHLYSSIIVDQLWGTKIVVIFGAGDVRKVDANVLLHNTLNPEWAMAKTGAAAIVCVCMLALAALLAGPKAADAGWVGHAPPGEKRQGIRDTWKGTV